MLLCVYPSAWAQILVCQYFSAMPKMKFSHITTKNFKSLPISEPITWFIKRGLGFVFFRLYLEKDVCIKLTRNYSKMIPVRITYWKIMFFIGQRYTYSFKRIKISSYYKLVKRVVWRQSRSRELKETKNLKKSRVGFVRRSRKGGDPGDGVGS